MKANEKAGPIDLKRPGGENREKPTPQQRRTDT